MLLEICSIIFILILLKIYESYSKVKRIERDGGKGEFHYYVVSGKYKRDRMKQKSVRKKKRWQIFFLG